MDTTTGLWFHGWQFDGNGGGHNYAKALWARGNCGETEEQWNRIGDLGVANQHQTSLPLFRDKS
jgi:hypothetical protein